MNAENSPIPLQQDIYMGVDWRGFEPLTSRDLGQLFTCEASVTTAELPALVTN
jgi:hypothetical protein